jgi:hypothetical protein
MLAPSLQRAADFAVAAQWQQRLQRYKIFGPQGHVLRGAGAAGAGHQITAVSGPFFLSF